MEENMKKIEILLLLVIFVFAAVSCSAPAGESPAASAPASSAPASNAPAENTQSADAVKIKVGASPTPHAEILEAAKPILAEKGIDMEIVEFSDYVLPNKAVDSEDIDANYFQHKPYLDNFNEENGTDLVSIGAFHYEPLGVYAGKTASFDALADGAQISVPNDPTNEARALLLLQENGVITLKDGADINATKQDIADNPKNIDIVEMEAAQLGRSIADVDMAVINGNYAIQAGLDVADAIAKEESDSLAAQTYGNVVAVKAGRENDEALKALAEVLKSKEIQDFITEKYEGSVLPLTE